MCQPPASGRLSTPAERNVRVVQLDGSSAPSKCVTGDRMADGDGSALSEGVAQPARLASAKNSRSAVRTRPTLDWPYLTLDATSPQPASHERRGLGRAGHGVVL